MAINQSLGIFVFEKRIYNFGTNKHTYMAINQIYA